MKKTPLITGILAFILIMLFSIQVSADETSVKIEAPEKVKKGTEVTVKIEVIHSTNNFLHYTDWVWVKVNDEEFKKWEYGNFDRPDDSSFTVELTLKIDETTTIEAKGNCNMHGSEGSEKVKITVE